MFLIAHNQVIVPKSYFEDVVPAVEDLSHVIGGVFLNRLTMDANNRILTPDECTSADEKLNRMVIMYFENREVFDKFWYSQERNDIWMVGANYAYYCDSLLDYSGQVKTMNVLDNEIQDVLRLKKLGMSNREAEIMYWIAQGKRNDDIAYILNLSVSTVKKHITNAYDKLGIGSRSAAAAIATEAMMGDSDPLRLLF